jgi:hypothetical protein
MASQSDADRSIAAHFKNNGYEKEKEVKQHARTPFAAASAAAKKNGGPTIQMPAGFPLKFRTLGKYTLPAPKSYS